MLQRIVGKSRAILFRLTHPRVKAGKSFAFAGALRVSGPGRVGIGDHTFFDAKTGRPNRISTLAPDARVTIGAGCYINGLELSCRVAVTIGEQCIIAECLMMDTDFHSVEIDRHTADAPVKTAPITIGRNVWIANKTIILRGITIGDNAVVAAGAVVTRDVPANVVVAGNPARVVRTLRA